MNATSEVLSCASTRETGDSFRGSRERRARVPLPHASCLLSSFSSATISLAHGSKRGRWAASTWTRRPGIQLGQGFERQETVAAARETAGCGSCFFAHLAIFSRFLSLQSLGSNSQREENAQLRLARDGRTSNPSSNGCDRRQWQRLPGAPGVGPAPSRILPPCPIFSGNKLHAPHLRTKDRMGGLDIGATLQKNRLAPQSVTQETASTAPESAWRGSCFLTYFAPFSDFPREQFPQPTAQREENGRLRRRSDVRTCNLYRYGKRGRQRSRLPISSGVGAPSSNILLSSRIFFGNNFRGP